jgi:phospholipid/cholesterol/gamma-HCH transport system substrate-binding protein
MAKDGQQFESIEPVETDAIMMSLAFTAENAVIISDQLAEIMIKINSGSGTLGRLIQDSTIAENLNQTIMNLKQSSRGLGNQPFDAFRVKEYERLKQNDASILLMGNRLNSKLRSINRALP